MRSHTTFDNYQAATPSQEAALSHISGLAQAILLNLKENKGSLVPRGSQLVILEGNPGTGKSHLIEALHRTIPVKDQYKPISFIVDKPLGYVFTVMSPVFVSDAKVVLIDDLLQSEGTNLTQMELSTLSAFLYMAYQNNMIVVAGTNHSAENLIQQVIAYDQRKDSIGRLESRLQEMTRKGQNILKIEGPDGRESITAGNSGI